MKIVPSIAGMLLAGTFAATAHAGPSKGQVMTECKAEINDTYEQVDRIRTSRCKYKATGHSITFKVSTGGEIEKVTCKHKDGETYLTDANGDMIAKAGDEVSTES